MKLSNIKKQFLENLTEFYNNPDYGILKRNWKLMEKVENEKCGEDLCRSDRMYLSERMDAITGEFWNATDEKYGEDIPYGVKGVITELAFERLECIFTEDEIKDMDDDIAELYEKYLVGDDF